MKILVFSDSHCVLRFMRSCVEAVKPDAIIHLGDTVRDGDVIAQDHPAVRFFQVAGNCDRFRVAPDFPEILVERFSGVKVFMTHGHLHGVKLYLDKLIAEGRKCGADVILYGHTHMADCRQLEDGVWIMNPGSAGFDGGSAGIIRIGEDGTVSCNLIRQIDLEGMQ